MADRQAGALRWGRAEKEMVAQYIKDGRLDPTRMNSATYLAHLKTLEPIWNQHANKNFYQNVRRAVAAVLAEGQGIGQRRQDQNAPPPDAMDVDDDDDGDDFVDANEEEPERPEPRAAGECPVICRSSPSHANMSSCHRRCQQR